MTERAAIDAFVISLPRASARRAAVTQTFAKAGLSFTFFDGVDGIAEWDRLIEQTDVKAWERNMGAPVTAGHLGCYAAHVGLWDQIGKGAAPMALIAEDDIRLSPEFGAALEAALALQGQWDILRFAKIRAKLPRRVAAQGAYDLNVYLGPFTGNGCYLIKRETAACLAAQFWPIRRAHDHELNRFFAYDLKLMGLEPFAAAPDDGGESFITGTEMSGVQKFPKYRRVPHYAQKLGNYLRRYRWLKAQSLI